MTIFKIINGFRRNILKGFIVIKHEGISTVLFKTVRYYRKKFFPEFSTNPISDKDYQKWRTQNLEKRYLLNSSKIKSGLKISILMPTYNTVPKELEEAIESVKNQFYTNWELCIVDDASTSEETKNILKKYENSDPRIKIKFNKINQGISGVSNSILEFVTGNYVALMDHDDVITKDALFLIAQEIERSKNPDYLYTDEDLLDPDRGYIKPNFKPDWSKFFAECTMYPLHMSIYKTSIIKELKFRDEAKGTQDWDLLLRAMSKKEFRAAHIPHVCYSWRLTPASTSVTMSTKPYVFENQEKALRNYLKINKIEGEILKTENDGRYRIKRKILNNPKISVIIPTKDKVNLLKDSVESVLNNTYKNFEVIIISNNSKEKETFDYFENLKSDSRIKVIEYNHPFNFSKINNFGVEQATGEIILLLNNDVKAINNDWMESMLEYTQLDEVGVVGAKLIYANDTIQHAGIVYGTETGVTNVMAHFPADSPGYDCYLQVPRNYSAVIGACFMVKKKDYLKVGGLDENLGLLHQEVDMCFKLNDVRKQTIYTPFAKLYHFESATRGNDPISAEWIKNQKYFEEKWKEKLSKPDPFYNPNLSKKLGNYSLKWE